MRIIMLPSAKVGLPRCVEHWQAIGFRDIGSSSEAQPSLRELGKSITK